MRKACIKSIKETNSAHTIICVAGSGWGGLACQLSKAFPNTQIIGYEAALAPWFVSQVALLKYRATGHHNLSFKKSLFKKVKFPANCTVVAYLYPKGTQALFQQLLQQEQPPKAFLSIAFAVNQQTAHKKWATSDLWHTPLYFYTLTQ